MKPLMLKTHHRKAAVIALLATACTGINEDTSLLNLDSGDPIPSTESVGCGTEQSGVRIDLDVRGETRTFKLSTPDEYDANKPYPLVFAWHGLGGNGAYARAYFGFQANAHKEAVVVYPDALPLEVFGGSPGWDLSEGGYDIAYFDALYTHITENLCIDTARVFSTGHSFGAYMSNTLGCYRSDLLNAIAPVAGGLGALGTCGDQLGVWITHGTSDPTVPFSEGTNTREHWLTINQCSSDTTTFSSDCIQYTDCEREVQWCEHNGGHEWPRFAGEAIWTFFAGQAPKANL